ncbi:carbonic anhydrase family protein [Salmonella enterica]|uniref:Alpha-carbonic anhydrase domain-containing protein n=1 Tax=Salmonella enterica subsp. enterica serovar Pensacola TaxID=34042 RepID=A0A602Z5Y5_SALET|nr:hypothetical protein [Salmonella enterica subsp. enterica serovar Pensacola]EAQ4575444.1 hypothetical protein [Salmonella enterica]EDQ0314237.1 hypothetical protein [Salmonella enterica subsp. enterica serovar Berta]EDV7397715.1 hypothetical protein [Salmonella enterica subsp. enterica]EAV2407294.1 hypothetical protein [Salmonella enterica]
MRLDKTAATSGQTYWRFNGPQPSPSCLVNAVRVVLQHPLTLSSTQLEKFMRAVHEHKSASVRPFRLAMEKNHAQREVILS